MAELDHWCALCGLLCGALNDFEGILDYNIIGPATNLSWIDETVVISENPNALTRSKVYVTGIGKAANFSQYEVQRGRDTNFDTSLHLSFLDATDDTKSRYLISVHQDNSASPFAIPMHAVCYREILPRVIASRMFPRLHASRSPIVGIDQDALYHVLQGLYSFRRYSQGPDLIDFEDAGQCHDENWILLAESEWLIMEPRAIDKLNDYYQDLPRLSTPNTEEQLRIETKLSSNRSRNIFSTFPEHLMMLLLSYLPMRDINAFRASSPEVAGIVLSPRFWRTRILNDMPWLYDLPYKQGDEAMVDWRLVYLDLKALSHKYSRQQFHGLASRRRIWKMCDRIVVQYIKEKAKYASSITESQLQLLSNATSSRARRLIWPEPRGAEIGVMLFINDISEIKRHKLIISAYMGDDVLTGLSINTLTNRPPSATIGSINTSWPRSEITIQEGDWIVGIIIISRGQPTKRAHDEPTRKIHGLMILTQAGRTIAVGQQDGDQRLIYVDKWKIAIGINVTWAVGYGVSRLELLQVPVEVGMLEAAVDLNPFTDYAGSAVSDYLWKQSLPAPQLLIGDFRTGYWYPSSDSDNAAKEALVLGLSEVEFSTIRAIAMDARLACFRVDYDDGSSRSIGQAPLAMYVLEIDGKNGERVRSIEVHVSHVIIGLAFVTNRGRRLIAGRLVGGMSSLFATDNTRIFAGVCGHWRRPESFPATLGCLAAIYVPPDEDRPNLMDLDTFNQIPEIVAQPYPVTWNATGSLFGDEDWAERTEFLDFSRPISKIDICLTHIITSAHSPTRLPLVGIMLKYQDELVSNVGPSEFHPPGDHDCWCRVDRPGQTEDSTKPPHYDVQSWEFQPQKIKYLHLWRADRTIQGIQFVTENGTKSPLWGDQWGDCIKDPTDKITFGGEPNVTGILCHIGSNRRSVTYTDMIIVALQALREGQP